MIGCKNLNESEEKLMIENAACERDKILLMIGFRTGFRISELLSLRFEDIQNNRVTVKRVNMKGAIKSRSVPIPNEVQDAVNAFRATIGAGAGGYVFMSTKPCYKSGQRVYRPITRSYAYMIVAAIAEKAGINGKVGTHSMRKTFANKVYNKCNKDLRITQLALGHASIDSTVKYLGVDASMADDVILSI